MYWRIDAAGCAMAALLQFLAAGAAGAAVPAAAINEAPAVGAAGAAGADREGCFEPLCYTASRLEAERNRMAVSYTHLSRAAFSITVSPSARTAAIMRFSVPVTVTVSSTRCAPLRRVARARMLSLIHI